MAGSNLPQLVTASSRCLGLPAATSFAVAPFFIEVRVVGSNGSMSLATLLSQTCPVLDFVSDVCCAGAFVPSLATGVGRTAKAFSRF